MNLSDDAERTIEKLRITTSAETDKRILNDAFVAFEQSAFQKSPKSGHDVRLNIFHNRIIKIAAVAAAVIIIFTVFLSRHITKTVNPEKIYAQLVKADGVSVSMYRAGEVEPYQQIWTTQNMKLFRTAEQSKVEFTLWDLSKNTKMMTFLSSNTIQTESITAKMLAELEGTITQSFGLLTDIKNIPENAKWTHINNPDVTATVPSSRVFELTWSQETTTGVVYRKWRIFIDTKTDLPLRAESYVKFTPEGRYELENFVIYTYPQEDEIKVLAEKTFDPAYRQPRQPTPIGTPGMQ